MVVRLIAAALVLATALGAHLARAEPSAVRASELIGERVLGREGGTVGEIGEVRLDVRQNGVHFIELGRFAYPVNALRREDGVLRLNVPAERLEGLPGNTLPEMRYVAAERVLGGPVDDPLGNRAGTLVDLAVDLQSGRTRYFLIEFESSGERLKLPAHNLRLQPAGNPVLQASRTRRG